MKLRPNPLVPDTPDRGERVKQQDSLRSKNDWNPQPHSSFSKICYTYQTNNRDLLFGFIRNWIFQVKRHCRTLPSGKSGGDQTT